MGARIKNKNKDKKQKKDKKKKGPPLASQADKYVLYQRSVQEPEADIEFFDQVFEAHFQRKPRILREDFCGTHFLSCTWVKHHPENRAIGVDLDPEPIAWGEAHNASKLTDEQRARMTILQGDVRDRRESKADVIAAQNFSFCCFKSREELRKYFEVARAGLADDGLFVLDIFGGPEALMNQEEETEYEDEGFSYVWDQDRFDAITNEILCKIHFRFPDESELKDAFIYDWRLWSIPELREILLEAGFRTAEAYWEGSDEDGEGDGNFTLQANAEQEDAWIAYVVGVR